MKARLVTGCVLAALIVALTGCGGSGNDPTNILSGKITVGGKPAPSVQIVATTADGKVGGGTSNEKGEYVMPDAPQGLLKFQFIGAASLPAGSVTVPAKYNSPQSGVTFEYKGGKVTKDFDLAP